MNWLDKFIVSERGQWDHPGKPTAVPTDNGIITMKGVTYPVMGFVPGQPPVMMQPGKNYKFPGKMVYEVPMVKAQVGLNVPSWLNPYNWGVENYTDKGNFSNAYEAAKKAGEKEFMYNDKRYNTRYAGTPRQEVGRYGVNGQPVDIDNSIRLSKYPSMSMKYMGHIAAENDGNVVDYGPSGNFKSSTQDVEKNYNVYNANKKLFNEVSKNLPIKLDPFKEEKNPNRWTLATNNCADNVCDSFDIPRSIGVQIPDYAIDKIKEKYPTLDVTGRTNEDYEKLYKSLQNESNEKILNQSENILGIASSPDIQYTSLARRLVSTVQATLDKEGYSLPKSTRKDWETRRTGKFDGVIGPETLNALKEWQSKNTKKNFGGDISIPDLSRPNWLDKYQDGGDKMNYTYSDEFGTMLPEVNIKPSISPEATQAILNREAGMSIAPAPSSFDRKVAQAQYMASNPFDAFGNYVTQGYVPQGNLGNYGMREKSSPVGQLLMDFNPYNWANAAYRAAIRGGDPDTYTTLPGAINMGADLAEALPVISELGPLLKSAKSAAGKAGKYLTTQTPLKNTYKYNPLAFKPEEGMMYRGLGEEGYLDAIQSSVLRPKQYGYDLGRSFAEKITTPKQFGSTYYTPAETFGIVENYGPKYVAEVPFEGNQFGKRYGRKNWSWSTPRQIPIEEAKLLQKDWLQGYKQINKSKQLPGSPNNTASDRITGPGPLMLGLSKFTHDVKNPAYFQKMLDSYGSNKLSNQSKQYFQGIIKSVEKQGGLATKKQYDMLQRLRTGDFNYGKKEYGGIKSSGEGYYDYINGYSGIFANGGFKGWLDNYK
jgi:peptidoglycan hydrolase-like protein with peptidoglycan-binding domain